MFRDINIYIQLPQHLIQNQNHIMYACIELHKAKSKRKNIKNLKPVIVKQTKKYSMRMKNIFLFEGYALENGY